MQFLGLTVRSRWHHGRCVSARGGFLAGRALTPVLLLPAPSLTGGHLRLTLLCPRAHVSPSVGGALLELLGAPQPASTGFFAFFSAKRALFQACLYPFWKTDLGGSEWRAQARYISM